MKSTQQQPIILEPPKGPPTDAEVAHRGSNSPVNHATPAAAETRPPHASALRSNSTAPPPPPSPMQSKPLHVAEKPSPLSHVISEVSPFSRFVAHPMLARRASHPFCPPRSRCRRRKTYYATVDPLVEVTDAMEVKLVDLRVIAGPVAQTRPSSGQKELETTEGSPAV